MLSVDRDQSVSELVRGWVVQAIGEGDREVHPLVRKVAKVESKSVEPPAALKPVEKAKVDQKTCKHSYVAGESGMVCYKCGYKTA